MNSVMIGSENIYQRVGHCIASELDFARLTARAALKRILTVHNEDQLTEPQRDFNRFLRFKGTTYDSATMKFRATSGYPSRAPALAEK